MSYVNTVLKPLTLAAMPAMNDAMWPGITVTIGMNSFGVRRDKGCTPGGAHVARRQRPLHLGEVRRPVAEAQHEADAEHGGEVERQDEAVQRVQVRSHDGALTPYRRSSHVTIFACRSRTGGGSTGDAVAAETAGTGRH
jgi:hypothetical protein